MFEGVIFSMNRRSKLIVDESRNGRVCILFTFTICLRHLLAGLPNLNSLNECPIHFLFTSPRGDDTDSP